MRIASLCLGAFGALGLGCASTTPHRVSAPAVRDDVHHVQVNGTEIAYTMDGTGPPLVIIHGAFYDYRSFALTVPILAEHRTVIRVSLPLHYPNPPPASQSEAQERYRIETHAADVVALIEKLGLGPVDLLGHSRGGNVAALTAQSRPGLVRHLILAEPSVYGLLRGKSDSEVFIAEERQWRDEALTRFRAAKAANKPPVDVIRAAFDFFDSIPETPRKMFQDNYQTMEPCFVHGWMDMPYSCEDARQLKMPVLILEGARTSADMGEIITTLLGCLPDARRIIFAGSGHDMATAVPEAVARAVLQFVRPSEAPGSSTGG